MSNEIQSIADNLGIHDKIIMRTEFVSEEERIRHYAAADLVVLPSLYEPFGIVCTEAMSMEKPTVVGARGTNGMREQIIPSGEKQCGIHINPFEPKDIAWGIIQVLQSQDKAVQWGKNGRQRVLEEFSWDAVNRRTLDIYKEFLR
jgi:glycosyltransferase involved in cell wall biosynthesis